MISCGMVALWAIDCWLLLTCAKCHSSVFIWLRSTTFSVNHCDTSLAQLLPPNGTLCQVQYSLWPSLAFSYIGNVTAWHSICGRQPNFVAFTRGRHLYLAGRPSSWPLAHILVLVVVVCCRRLQKKYHVCINTGKTSHVHMSKQSNSKVMMLMMGILW